MERAARVHEHVLELWKVLSDSLRSCKLVRSSRWSGDGSRSSASSNRLWTFILHRLSSGEKVMAIQSATGWWLALFLLDRRVLNLMGHSVPAKKPRSHWSSSSCTCWVARRSSFAVCRRSKHGRKQTEELHAARWKNSPRIHVHYTHSFRAELLPSHSRHCRIDSYGSRHRWDRRWITILSNLIKTLSSF